MMDRLRALFWPVLLISVPTVAIAIPTSKDPLLAGVEFFVQLFLIFMFGRDIVSSYRREQPIRSFQVIFLAAIIIAFVADTLYNLRIIAPGSYSKSYNHLVESLYPLFAIVLGAAVFKGIRLSHIPVRKWFRVGFPAFLIYEFLTFKFLTMPTFSVDRTLSLKSLVITYNLAMGFLFAVAIAFSLRSVARRPFYFFQLLLLLPVADLAIRFQTTFISTGSFAWAELGWCTTFVGLGWLFSEREAVHEMFAKEAPLAPLMSFRTLLSLSVCGANILFLTGILIFKVYSMESAIDVSSALLLLYLFWLGANELSIRLADDLDQATLKLFRSNKHVSTDGFINLTIEEVEPRAKIHELNQILDSYNDLVQQTNKMIQAQSVANRNATIAEIASQVAHDVRSPLSALNMVLSTLDPLPENKRMVIRNATQRITDIANSLALRGQSIYEDSSATESAQSQMILQKSMIVSIAEALVSEKRLQFRDRADLQIEGFFTLGYGLFSEVNRAELCRVLSNLINNSVEALPAGRLGLVNLAVSSDKDAIYILIKDNGKGIPQDLLKRVGERGFSYGKQSGSGLGIHHARSVVQKFNGELRIESAVNHGTQVTIRLPRCSPPPWFVDALDLSKYSTLISVDDDSNIHEIWRERLSQTSQQISHYTFSSVQDFSDWYQSSGQHKSPLFLLDYEFHGEAQTGLHLIEKFSLQPNAIIVSSRYDEPVVRNHVEKLGVRMIPKSLAVFVPIIASAQFATAHPFHVT